LEVELWSLLPLIHRASQWQVEPAYWCRKPMLRHHILEHLKGVFFVLPIRATNVTQPFHIRFPN
jgi:hypothetical protein